MAKAKAKTKASREKCENKKVVAILIIAIAMVIVFGVMVFSGGKDHGRNHKRGQGSSKNIGSLEGVYVRTADCAEGGNRSEALTFDGKGNVVFQATSCEEGETSVVLDGYSFVVDNEYVWNAEEGNLDMVVSEDGSSVVVGERVFTRF